MAGTFGGALEARQIPASAGKLVAEAGGEVELEGNVLVLKRIHVKMLLEAEPAQRETAERVHGFFAQACPIYRSIHPQIAVTTELIFR
ncbi:MAG: OsmC family protein [Myxococcales bacterium]